MEVTNFCGFCPPSPIWKYSFKCILFNKKKIEGFIKLDPFRLNSSQRIFEDVVKINTIRIS